MEIGKSLYVTNRDEWRSWLADHHETEDEIWLIYYKKHTGKPRIPYDDAVEEAICFGWIDGTVKKINEEKYAQRYTPRRKKSVWSDLNKSRARKMIESGKMTSTGLEKLGYHLNEEVASPKMELTIPLDLKDALSSDLEAWENFNNFATSYRQDYIGWVISAKREDTRQRRISAVVKRSKDNIKPGMM
ncbi:MAG: YdeI/OmpD-associated family protein [Halobacteriota archaeon]|nr:YdeI/OmpD-associated family protein [Halobacteriota archaeon]